MVKNAKKLPFFEVQKTGALSLLFLNILRMKKGRKRMMQMNTQKIIWKLMIPLKLTA